MSGCVCVCWGMPLMLDIQIEIQMWWEVGEWERLILIKSSQVIQRISHISYRLDPNKVLS